MKVVIAKVHDNLFAGEAESLMAPTTGGVVTILGHHEPLVATLVPGMVTVKAAGVVQDYPVTGGVLEVSSDQVTVLL